MNDIYQENILDHYRHPHHQGTLKQPTHTIDGANLSCGDEITWQLIIDHDKLTDAAFTGRACAICTASASMLSDIIIGQTLSQINQLQRQDIEAQLGIPLSPVRLKCALLPLETLKNLKLE